MHHRENNSLVSSKNNHQLKKESTESQETIKPISNTTRGITNPSAVIPDKAVSVAFAVILHECLEELYILGKIVDAEPVTVDLRYMTLEEKYEKAHELGDLPLESQPYTNELKFQKIRTFAETAIRETFHNLTGHDSYEVLQEIIGNYDRTVEQENTLLLETKDKERKLIDLKATLQKERQYLLQSIQDLSKDIGTLKDDYEDNIVDNELKMNYLIDWENTRNDLHNLVLQKEEDKYLNIKDHFNTEINREIRVHDELIAFLTETQQDYEDSIETWMERYDTEIEQRDNDIIVLKEKIETQHEDHLKLIDLYAKHEQEIADYLAHKEVKRLEAEELVRKIKAAIRIQAWWRGTMFRRKLGKYRKKGKGKGGKKGKNDNKKKDKKKK